MSVFTLLDTNCDQQGRKRSRGSAKGGSSSGSRLCHRVEVFLDGSVHRGAGFHPCWKRPTRVAAEVALQLGPCFLRVIPVGCGQHLLDRAQAAAHALDGRMVRFNRL